MVFCFASNINCIWRELCTRESFNTSNELIERPQSKPSQRKLNTTNNLRLLLCTIHNWEWQPEVSQQFALTLFFLSLSMKLLKLFKLRNIILFLFLCVHLLVVIYKPASGIHEENYWGMALALCRYTALCASTQGFYAKCSICICCRTFWFLIISCIVEGLMCVCVHVTTIICWLFMIQTVRLRC